MNTSGKLKVWLRRALWFVPLAYLANFLYAILSDQSGGTFGDTFGAANALFSGAALMMLVYAVILQREELEVVKEERNATRELLAGQEEINRLQKSSLDQQIFEQSFSSQLTQVLSERERLNRQSRPSDANSRTFMYLAADAATNLIEQIAAGNDIRQADYFWDKKSAYAPFPYVNLIVHLATFIDQSELDERAKNPLRQLINSVLDPEVCTTILLYHAETLANNQEMINFGQFIEKYRAMEYVETSILNSYTAILSD